MYKNGNDYNLIKSYHIPIPLIKILSSQITITSLTHFKQHPLDRFYPVHPRIVHQEFCTQESYEGDC